METRTSNGHGVTLEKLISDLRVVVGDGRDLLKTGASQLRSKAIAGAKATDQRIRRNPYPSLGIIFGVGVVVGILGYALMRGAGDNSGEEFD